MGSRRFDKVQESSVRALKWFTKFYEGSKGFKMFQEEIVNTEGKVVLKSQEGSPGQRQRQWAEKRPRSPGSTPPARGGQRSSRFGVRE